MALKVMNTLTKKKEEFKPLKDKEVKMYVCGVTVYDYTHLGHLRNYIAFDVIQRYLEYKGYKVKRVQNFTDIDDKIIKRADEEGRTEKEVAEEFIKVYFEDMQPFEIKEASVYPKVTETIPEIISFIQDLIDKGYAYEKNGSVYFRVARFKDYGKLSGVNLEELKKHRIEPKPEKEDPRDFALWKKATDVDYKTNAVFKSPWGDGRPGWHIECSVMVWKHLGETIDIHGGGKDLIFPHHENEIAQSEARNGKPFARYWMHVEFLNINKEKMSKSLKNFISVRDALKKYDPEVLRFLFSTIHYRQPIDFSEEEIENARNNFEKVRNALQNILSEIAYLKEYGEEKDENVDDELKERVRDIVEEFEKAMDDDFNASKALIPYFEFVKLINVYVEKKDVGLGTLQHLLENFLKLSHIYGFFQKVKEFRKLTKEERELIEKREKLRKEKNFEEADKIRELLREKGIILNDTKKGVRWIIQEN